MPHKYHGQTLGDERRLSQLGRQSPIAQEIQMQFWLSGFAYGVDAATNALALKGSSFSEQRTIPSKDLLRDPLSSEANVSPRHGLVDAFAKTCERWKLSEAESAILIGYYNNTIGAEQIVSGRMAIPSEDVRDRMSYIVAISLELGALFDENPESEVAWLVAKRDALAGLSVKEILLSGKFTDLLTAWAFAQDEVKG